eukprot:11597-Eustigmatos_ZCMA.PRE.1
MTILHLRHEVRSRRMSVLRGSSDLADWHMCSVDIDANAAVCICPQIRLENASARMSGARYMHVYIHGHYTRNIDEINAANPPTCGT